MKTLIEDCSFFLFLLLFPAPTKQADVCRFHENKTSCAPQDFSQERGEPLTLVY